MKSGSLPTADAYAAGIRERQWLEQQRLEKQVQQSERAERAAREHAERQAVARQAAEQRRAEKERNRAEAVAARTKTETRRTGIGRRRPMLIAALALGLVGAGVTANALLLDGPSDGGGDTVPAERSEPDSAPSPDEVAPNEASEATDLGRPSDSGTETAASVQTCPRFTIGPATFDAVSVVGVSCSRARDLLDRTTLSQNRRDRESWEYAGWAWSAPPTDEFSRRIVGVRGSDRIEATWSQA